MVRWLRVVVAVWVVGSVLGLQGVSADAGGGRGSVSFVVDNDLFDGLRRDGQYTSGLQVAWLSGEAGVPQRLGWVADWLETLNRGADSHSWGLALGQNIYTPDRVFWVPPDPDDRPYAGWLYGAVNVAVRSDARLTSFEVQLGVVGPSARGQEAQRFWHDLFGDLAPRGWDFQLRDEPGLNLIMTHMGRVRLSEGSNRPGGLAVDAVPSLTAGIGNVQTFLGTGVLFRVGTNLWADFGPPMIRPPVSGAGSQVARSGRGWYVFAGVEGRAVARDIFLDGNTFRSGPRVEKKSLVRDVRLGFALVFRRGSITYSHCFRSLEFDGQARPFRYGSVIVTIHGKNGGRPAPGAGMR